MERTPTLCYVIRAYEGLVIHLKNRMRSKSGIGLMHAYDTAVKKIEQYLAKCSENPIYSMAIGQYESSRHSVHANNRTSGQPLHQAWLDPRQLVPREVRKGSGSSYFRGNVHNSPFSLTELSADDSKAV